jgi:hypothetical protein
MRKALDSRRRRIRPLSLTIPLILMLMVSALPSFASWDTSSVPDFAATVTQTNVKYSLGMKGNQILFHDGFWYVFYFNGSDSVSHDGAILYRFSSDGENWSNPRIAADNPDVSAYFSVYEFNETLVVAYSTMPPENSTLNSVVYTRKGTFTASDITWNDPMILFGGPEIAQTVGSVWGDYSFGRHWLAVEFLDGGGGYDCEIFSTADFTSWSLSKYWHTNTGGFVTVTLRYVENRGLMAVYSTWLNNEFDYMFFDGSTWSEEAETQGSGLSSECYKAQCEVVINGTLYMLYSTWDYITPLKLAVYNGNWHFSDFLPDTRYWGGDSSATFDSETGTAFFFYVDAYTNEVLTAYSTNYSSNIVEWTKNAKVGNISFDSPRFTGTVRISDGKIAVYWSEGQSAPFKVKFVEVSPSLSPNPNEGTPTLTFSTDSSTAFVGYQVGMNGTLTDANGTGILDAHLALAYSVTNGETWDDISSITTTVNGSYLAEWMPSASGNYLLRISYAGNGTLGFRATAVYSTLAVIPVEESYVFSVVSNSTVSDLAFNLTAKILTFTVSGPSGTTGYAEVVIGKELIDDISQLIINVDLSPVNYSVIAKETKYVLRFTYQHSIHMVAITFSAELLSQPYLMTPVTVGILAFILAFATVGIALKKHPKSNATVSSNRGNPSVHLSTRPESRRFRQTRLRNRMGDC